MRPHTDAELRTLLKKAWRHPLAYAAFADSVRPFLAATLLFYDDNSDRVNESCQEACDALQVELDRGWNDRRNYLLELVALAQSALARRKRPQVLVHAAAQFGVSPAALFAALHSLAEAGTTRCSGIWRAHLLVGDQESAAL